MNCAAAGRRPANFHKRNYLLSVNTTDFEKTTIQAHSALCPFCRETRDGNNLYQELSFTDNDALADIDEGADLTGGKQLQHAHIIGGANMLININVTFSAAKGGWVHPSEFASSGQ